MISLQRLLCAATISRFDSSTFGNLAEFVPSCSDRHNMRFGEPQLFIMAYAFKTCDIVFFILGCYRLHRQCSLSSCLRDQRGQNSARAWALRKLTTIGEAGRALLGETPAVHHRSADRAGQSIFPRRSPFHRTVTSHLSLHKSRF